MSKHGYVKACPREFRKKVMQLVQVSDRTVRQVAEEFEISTDSVGRWVKQAELDQGKRKNGLGSAERGELVRPRHEVRLLKLEREILSRAAALFAREADSIPSGSSNSQERIGGNVRSPRCASCRSSPPAGTVRGGSGRRAGGPGRTSG